MSSFTYKLKRENDASENFLITDKLSEAARNFSDEVNQFYMMQQNVDKSK